MALREGAYSGTMCAKRVMQVLGELGVAIEKGLNPELPKDPQLASREERIAPEIATCSRPADIWALRSLHAEDVCPARKPLGEQEDDRAGCD